jgi:hypothetical protein
LENGFKRLIIIHGKVSELDLELGIDYLSIAQQVKTMMQVYEMGR